MNFLRKLLLAATESLFISVVVVLVRLIIDAILGYIEPGSIWQLLYSSVILFLVATFLLYFVQERLAYEILRYRYRSIKSAGSDSDTSLPKQLRKLIKRIYKDNLQSELEIKLLREKERFRKEYLGNVSHELKTPLFTIQGYVLTLLDGAYTKKKTAEKYLKRTAIGVDRLISIVNELDTITKLESGSYSVDSERFDIVKLISKVFDLFEIEGNKKAISTRLEAWNSGKIYVWADKPKIQQVITNLISNSIAYGKKNGETVITLRAIDKEKLRISVRDDGPGIEKRHIPRLFERFYRIDKTRNRNLGGSGLGLAIVKHILEAHGEDIVVSSELGAGSDFSFTLPIYNTKKHHSLV